MSRLAPYRRLAFIRHSVLEGGISLPPRSSHLPTPPPPSSQLLPGGGAAQATHSADRSYGLWAAAHAFSLPAATALGVCAEMGVELFRQRPLMP
eukprot:scaffold329820_cov54-Tisochrysis_lutea.AAC.1